MKDNLDDMPKLVRDELDEFEGQIADYSRARLAR